MVDQSSRAGQDAIVLDISLEDGKIKAAAYERAKESNSTLRSYELHNVDWSQVDTHKREIISLLNRANKKARIAPEILSDLKKSAQVLFDLLVPPKVRDKLNHTTARYLILYVDDRLIQIPWELLYNGREFLCRRFAMGRIVSTRQAEVSQPSRDLSLPLRVLVLADPQGNLEASYREGTEIRNFLDEKRETFHVDFKSHPADLSYVKKSLRAYDIIHYAGHANYDSRNPAESGWLLTNGRLTAGEVSAMGGLNHLPTMVFCNACHSGRTDEWQVGEHYEEQIYGLANAFLRSGVRHYIGTFWEISDEPGLHFAVRFYSHLARGESVGEGLRKARHDFTEEYGEGSIIWASYMLYGDPAFAFDSADGELTVRSVAPEQSHMKRGQGMSGSMPAQTVNQAKTRAATYLYGLLGVFILILGFLGYSHFYSNWGSSPKINAVNSVTPLRLSMNVIGQKEEANGGYTEVLIKEGSVLRSREKFQVHFMTNRPANSCVLLYDSRGKARQLFPDPKLEETGFVETSRKVVAPDKDLWFWLDENPGTETIYVLAFAGPKPGIPELLKEMEAAGTVARKRASKELRERIASRQRGVGGISKGEPVTFSLNGGEEIEGVTEVVKGSGGVVRAISFQHK